MVQEDATCGREHFRGRSLDAVDVDRWRGREAELGLGGGVVPVCVRGGPPPKLNTFHGPDPSRRESRKHGCRTGVARRSLRGRGPAAPHPLLPAAERCRRARGPRGRGASVRSRGRVGCLREHLGILDVDQGRGQEGRPTLCGAVVPALGRGGRGRGREDLHLADQCRGQGAGHGGCREVVPRVSTRRRPGRARLPRRHRRPLQGRRQRGGDGAPAPSGRRGGHCTV
mmetsp:Transcript_77609/g.251281  ORF Transcript_77609/g.251281 Transcript_77609/m.251281 type:complete len:227 (-) Transcript_77609:1484-2164(-)